MKIRSNEELVEFLDGQLAWRKKEIAVLAGLIDTSREFQKQALTRAGVAMLYAHWEGFVKEAATAYCVYVRAKRPLLSRVQPSFLAVIVRTRLRGSNSTRRIGPYMDALGGVVGPGDNKFDLPPDNIVDTESNLNFGVFTDISTTIGLDISDLATKANLIDEGLVARRHKIAHGERVNLDSDDFDTLRADVVACIEAFAAKIQNAAALRAYLRPAA
jgi:hypothetical protein